MPNSVADFPWNPTHVDETTLVQFGNAVLHTIVANKIDADTCTVVVYDGIDNSGEVMGAIVTGLSQPVTLLYDCKCVTGIYIEILGEGTADLTVNHI